MCMGERRPAAFLPSVIRDTLCVSVDKPLSRPPSSGPSSSHASTSCACDQAPGPSSNKRPRSSDGPAPCAVASKHGLPSSSGGERPAAAVKGASGRLTAPQGVTKTSTTTAAAASPGATRETVRRAGKWPKTRFEELLTQGFESRNDARAFEEERRLQRVLEKRLGVKKVGKGHGGYSTLV